jgi:hypothetical protein
MGKKHAWLMRHDDHRMADTCQVDVFRDFKAEGSTEGNRGDSGLSSLFKPPKVQSGFRSFHAAYLHILLNFGGDSNLSTA